jgi:hypothetical protein
VSDVNLQESAPPPIDNTRKEVAARLLAQANAHLDEHPDERVPPKRPMRDGIYTFPCYWNVIPLWVGAAFGLLVNLALFEVLLEIIQSGGLGSIMAAFLVPIFTLCLFGLVALVLPHFLTIIEFTADGYDKVPHWPSQDFLSRMHAMLLGINALAMSTAPGMLLLLPFRSLGMPLWPGAISTILLLPLVVLSMLETNSVFIPYSKFVFGSLFRVPLAWQQFYVQVLLLAAGILAVDYAVWQVSVEASRVVTVFTVTVYAVIYARLVGRIAYVLGQLETDEPVDEDEDADEEEEARG